MAIESEKEAGRYKKQYSTMDNKSITNLYLHRPP